jgi:hypothetical protein
VLIHHFTVSVWTCKGGLPTCKPLLMPRQLWITLIAVNLILIGVTVPEAFSKDLSTGYGIWGATIENADLSTQSTLPSAISVRNFPRMERFVGTGDVAQYFAWLFIGFVFASRIPLFLAISFEFVTDRINGMDLTSIKGDPQWHTPR